MESGQIVAGKYRLSRPLGAGGMAEVWAATNSFTERQVAIKFMSPAIAKTPDAAARFLNEAKVSARVNHANIIDILDVGQTESGQLFLVMELLTGLSLDAAMRESPMTLRTFVEVMTDVARALAAAHRSGIVHRDLKPTNIFLHRTGEQTVPKLLDFGVSKFLEEDQNHALTIAGTVLGSPLYMSPEQARGETNLDGRTDVFAFGAILFEAFSGQRPYDAKNFNGLIVKVATTRPRSIDECARHIPEALRQVVKVCLEPDLSRRARGFDEVIPVLEAALAAPSAATTIVVNLAPPAFPTPPSLSSQPTSPWVPTGSITAPASAATVRRSGGGGARAWLGVTGAFVLLGILIGVTLGLRGSGERRSGPAHANPPTLTSAELPRATSRPEPPIELDPPIVNVDALPGSAGERGAPSHLPSAAGRLTITSSIACVVSVDGASRGTTPVTLTLTAGTHAIACTPPSGHVKTTSLSVPRGGTISHAFHVE